MTKAVNMDTNPNQYSNILNALGGANGNQSQNPVSGLTLEQEAQNYNTFSELMKKGVSLPDLIAKIDSLEAKVKNMEENPTQSKINQELFEVMENAVRGDPDVKIAKQKVADVKSAIIGEMCMKDQRFRDALDEYKTAVNASYIRSKEKPTEE